MGRELVAEAAPRSTYAAGVELELMATSMEMLKHQTSDVLITRASGKQSLGGNSNEDSA